MNSSETAPPKPSTLPDIAREMAADLAQLDVEITEVDLLIAQVEKRKYAATTKPRSSQRPSKNTRHIPAAVRRVVWQRDGGKCTFVSDGGKRCEARARLEYDHANPVARGGETTVAGLRLRCRAHNQYAAECTYGAAFMSEKREEARREAAEAKAHANARAKAEAEANVHARARAEAEAAARARAEAEAARDRDVVPWLRKLGFSVQRARHGAELCSHIPDAPIEERMRVALRGLAPNAVRRAAHVGAGPA